MAASYQSADTIVLPKHDSILSFRTFWFNNFEYSTASEGVLKVGSLQGGEIASITYRRVWDKARGAALSPAEYVSPLGKRVYDLRH